MRVTSIADHAPTRSFFMNAELNIIQVICPFMIIIMLGRLALYDVTHSKQVYHIHQPANEPYDEDEDIQCDGP